MTVVKICGITNLDDALCAVDAGADMLGFIFYPPSPRSTSVQTARDIVSNVKHQTSNMFCVGVFVNETPAHMLSVMAQTGLDAIQLSGNEPIETVRAISPYGFKVVRKFEEVATFGSQQKNSMLPELVLEADHPTLYGGTGQRADEALAVRLARSHRLMLTGGLTLDNVAEVVRAVQPWGVDVASGVEMSKGKKDHAKVRVFVQRAKSTPQPTEPHQACG
jgi:phosphoribosylanthranilate isomerase